MQIHNLVTGAPASTLVPTPGLAVASDRFNYHAPSGLLYAKVTSDVDGVKMALQTRSLLLMRQTSSYQFVAGTAFMDAYDSAVAAVGVNAVTLLEIMRHAISLQWGLQVNGNNNEYVTAAAAPEAKFSSPGTSPTIVRDLLVADTGPSPTTGNTFGVFHHAFLSAVGCSSIDVGGISYDYTSQFDAGITGSGDIVTYGGDVNWADSASRLAAWGPLSANSAVALVPTKFTVEQTVDKLAMGVPSEVRQLVKAKVKELITLHTSFALNSVMYEPTQIAWRTDSLDANGVTVVHVDPFASVPRYNSPELTTSRGGCPLFGSRVKGTGGVRYIPMPAFDADFKYQPSISQVNRDKMLANTRGVVYSLGGLTSVHNVCHPVTKTIDGMDTAGLFGLQPFGAFFDPTSLDWANMPLRALTGDHAVVGNWPNRSSFGLNQSNDNPTLGQPSGGQTANAAAGSAVVGARLPGGSSMISRSSQLDTYTLTARTLSRIMIDCVYENGTDIYFDVEAAQRMLIGNSGGYAFPTLGSFASV